MLPGHKFFKKGFVNGLLRYFKEKHIETVSCNLCGSNDYSSLFEAKDRLHGLPGSFSYVRCTACGLVFQNPRPTLDEIKNFYPTDYKPHQSSDVPSGKISRRFRPVLNKLGEQSRLLDVGCGSGKFLNLVKNSLGCSVFGLDISGHAVETARDCFGLDIYKGLVTDAPFSPGFFDMITAWQYLEHVHNPLQILRKFSEFLKHSGLCLIATPNFDSFNAKLFKSRWYPLDCPRHLYLYTPQTLSLLLRKAGLQPLSFTFDPSSRSLLMSLQYYFYDNNYSPQTRDKIKKSLFFKTVFSPLTRILAMFHKSDYLAVFAKKLSSNELINNK